MLLSLVTVCCFFALSEPTQSVLWPGAMGDADSGGSIQRFRRAAGRMAGGGKARGNLHIDFVHTCALFLNILKAFRPTRV